VTVRSRPSPDTNSSLPEEPEAPDLPRHVAIIMDGNGRWATARRQPRTAGHAAGTENVRAVIKHFVKRGVQYVTLFAFSTENWARPSGEVSALLSLLQNVIEAEAEELHRSGVRILHIGRLDRLPGELRQAIRHAVELTRENRTLTLTVAFDYGGRADIVAAVKRIVDDGVQPAAIDEGVIGRYLSTAGVPDPDLLIRTAGELRISNFLLWQLAYAEFYSTPVQWPDFNSAEVDRALEAYAQRRRRFGGVEDS
jgi:undecaprenyl diphosphate synthase